MLKFVSIMVSLGFLEFGSLENANKTQIEDVKVEFSMKAIGIESGQPIFAKGTTVLVSNPTEIDINLYINDDEKEMSKKQLEIADLDKGTYTIMIVDAEKTEEKRTVGFTIQ